MPYSSSYFKPEIRQHFLQNIVKRINILDAGAGCGTYAKLLRNEFPNMDGLEIHQQYAEMFDLQNQYRNFFIGDIMTFDIEPYEYIILGDIVEHLNVQNAQTLLIKIMEMDKLCLVAVPYMFPQGIEFNNKYEVHLQPDLTEQVFLERYPMLKLLFGNHEYGYFINYEF